MIAAATAVSRVRQPASTPSTGWHFSPVPDLNTATHRAIGASGAGWTFETICRLIHHVGRVGRPKARQAAKAEQRIGVGIAAVAHDAGLAEGTVRRHLRRLQGLGLIVVVRPNVIHTRDDAGRLIENRTGRSQAVVIYLNVGPQHLRQAASQAAANPSRMEGLPATDSVHSGRAIQREEKTERRPDGQPAGIGRPPAAPEAAGTADDTDTTTDTTGTPDTLPDASRGRLTAAEAGGGLTAATEAGRLTAAVFERESDPIVPVDAGRDSPPDALAGRILPTPKAAPPDREAAARQASRERQRRLVRDFAYHLRLDESAVIELWRADPAGLRRRLIEAGVDPDTGRPRRGAAADGSQGRRRDGGDDHHRDAWRRALAAAAGGEAVTQ